MSNDIIAIQSIAFDEHSSFLQGPALAPKRIQDAFYSSSSNLYTEDGTNLSDAGKWTFISEIDRSSSDTYKSIQPHIEHLLANNHRVISLGGDHSITYPIIKAYAKTYPKLTILHLDAHPDLYDELDGNRYSHASPFARIMESRLASRLVQVGIRTLTSHQREQAKRFGVEIIEMRDIHTLKTLKLEGAVYLSLDMDCLDPAFAPGVSHHEPGGMSTREVLQLIQNMGGTLVGADIVEYNPERDINGMTAMVAAKFLKEILAKMMHGTSLHVKNPT